MKKFIVSFAAVIITALASFAADMSTVWEQFIQNPNFIVADFDAEKAAKNNFQTLTVALNSAPTTQDINTVQRLADTIDKNQKITSITRDGINISIYIAQASADMSLFKVMLIIDKNGEIDKTLMIFYGTCSQSDVQNAITNFSIEDLIG